MNAFIERHPIWMGVVLAAVFGAVIAAFSLLGDRDLSIFSLFRLLWIAALPTFMVRFRARVRREDAQAQGKPPPSDEPLPMSAAGRRFLQVTMFGPGVLAAAAGVAAIAANHVPAGAALLLLAGVTLVLSWGLLQDL